GSADAEQPGAEHADAGAADGCPARTAAAGRAATAAGAAGDDGTDGDAGADTRRRSGDRTAAETTRVDAATGDEFGASSGDDAERESRASSAARASGPGRSATG